MKKKILVFLILLINLCVFSQSRDVQLSMGLGGGIDMIINNDLSSSPLTYTGFGLPLALTGFKMTENWINHLEMKFILPKLTNNYSLDSKVMTRIVDWTKVNFRYQLLRRFGDGANNFLGGALKSSYFYREYDFLDGFGWEFRNSLNLTYARKVDLTTKSFVLPQVSLPLIGFVNRKPSLTYDEIFLDDFRSNGAKSLLKYGEWKPIFDEWLSFELSVLYHLSISERLNFQCSTGFNYYQIEFPERVQNINIPIICYLNYQF